MIFQTTQSLIYERLRLLAKDGYNLIFCGNQICYMSIKKGQISIIGMIDRNNYLTVSIKSDIPFGCITPFDYRTFRP